MRHNHTHPAYTTHQFATSKDGPYTRWYSVDTYYGRYGSRHVYKLVAHSSTNRRYRSTFVSKMKSNEKVARYPVYAYVHGQEHIIGEHGRHAHRQYTYLRKYYSQKSKGYRLP